VSHAGGEIWTPEGEFRGFFEYNGTADVVCTRVYKTPEAMQEHWRADCYRDCKCGNKTEDVVLYTTYGFGFYWKGKACWSCEAVTAGLWPFDDEDSPDTDGHPFFDKWLERQFGKVIPCPTCGEKALTSDGDRIPIVCMHCGAGWYEWSLRKAVR
jgi:hypothetical protein